ncbi:NADPH oxidase organizer 1 [Indicator indicator]|uniref:NADPH oxidase organizer 1 n=1 Tax=Indicator indicator TaxID=1002788 RepID=UPI0023DED442|nr:NADPH oxidase organizer 1 [Indicator indicator]
MMVVSWSDQNNLLIYRTFEDFRRLHKQLKRTFPTESGSVRKIPRFKDASVKQRKSGKPNRCLEVLKVLETYSQKLLKTDAQISQGEEVIQFFKAQTQDLDPSFSEDSLVIMPSETGGGKKAQTWKQLPPITPPQATQSYRCIEAFETKDTKNKTFQVTQEEIVEVLMKDMSGWWLVENTDKQLAWFPASYLEEIDVHKDIQNALTSKEEGSLYFVVQAYKCQKADELSLSSGVVVQVLRKSDNGWWLIRYDGCSGYVPCMCLKPYRNPHHKLQTIANCGLNVSTPSLCSSLVAPQRQVEQARSSALGHGLATHSSKSPCLSHRDRNDSGFVESSAADLSSSLADPDLATAVPKVPARPSAHEILQKCSTVTRRALQHSSSSRPALQALLPLPTVH